MPFSPPASFITTETDFANRNEEAVSTADAVETAFLMP